MKKNAWVLMVVVLILVPVQGRAEWVRLSGFPEAAPIERLASDPRDRQVLYAATATRLYRSLDGGQAWKRILSWRGEGRKIRFIYPDPVKPGSLYVCGDGGLRLSEDGGRHWESARRLPYDVFCATSDPSAPGTLWLGTSEGLCVLERSRGSIQKVLTFPQRPVYSIFREMDQLFAVTRDGIYRSKDQAQSWERILLTGESRSEPGEDAEAPLGQFDIEEIFSPAPLPPRAAVSPDKGLAYVATARGVARGSLRDDEWGLFESAGISGSSVKAVAASPGQLFTATENGLYRLEGSQGPWRAAPLGAGAMDIRDMLWDGRSGMIWAATSDGIYRFSALTPTPAIDAGGSASAPAAVDDLLMPYGAEPSIAEVQRAAIEYAEVQPEKIERWRQAAAKSALLPSVSVGADLSEDENIDLDRGGTADPDRFIAGPDERSFDWSVSLNWDLADLIWNNDQTSIDTRSRLMVQLRDDVLSEVTQLYFERRRVQVEIAASPQADALGRAERSIKLAELTARIDALTGGRFSRSLAAEPARRTIPDEKEGA